MSVLIRDQYTTIGPAKDVLTEDGQLGVMLEVYKGHIVMKTYSGFVDLSDAGQTFVPSCQNSVGVLAKGTTVTYTSEV